MFRFRARPSTNTIQRWTIAGRHRRTAFDIVEPSDFRLRRPVAISADAVASDPHLSLYCLDFERRVALLVELPSAIELAAAPFYYATQFNEATAVVTIPLALFEQLAAARPLHPERLIFIYSIGRCGSTLLSAAFRRVPNVRSLSEPDVFSQLQAWRGWDHVREAEVRALTAACLRWICHESSNTVHAIKFRAHGIALADVLAGIAPAARLLFLYRDARPWFDSVFRAFLRELDLESKALRHALEKYFAGMVRLVAEYQRPDRVLEPAEIWGLCWADAMEHALALTQQARPLRLLRYEDLMRAPEAAVRAVLEHCGLAADPARVLAALQDDSQSGTHVARARLAGDRAPVPPTQRNAALAIIGTRPVISRPDYILPGTWLPPADLADSANPAD